MFKLLQSTSVQVLYIFAPSKQTGLKNSLKIFKSVALIILGLLLYYVSGRPVQTASANTAAPKIKHADGTNLNFNTTSGFHGFIKEEIEDTEDVCCKPYRTALSEKKRSNGVITLKEYTSNEVFPDVILTLQTNLPPPGHFLPGMA